MILFDICNENESHPIYQEMQISNVGRHYDFLASLIKTCHALERQFLSAPILKALNYHAITCLHSYAGEYRPYQVEIRKGEQVTHMPPAHYRVDAMMDEMLLVVSRAWENADPFALAAFVLWRINFIHPFVNGNGRTARAACYFVLCLKLGGPLGGKTILPELIKSRHEDYCLALSEIDRTGDIGPLAILLQELVRQQLLSGSATEDATTPN